MSAVQKHAWFNLFVVALTAITVLALYPSLGHRAFGGFGVLGLAGLGALFHWRRGRQVVLDERDEAINRRATIWGYGVFWCVFVAAVVMAPSWFGDSVPVSVIQSSVWVGFMILLTVQSISALVQYRLGAVRGE